MFNSLGRMTNALIDAWTSFMVAFFKGDWLGVTVHRLSLAYHVTQALTYLVSIIVLVALAILSVGTIVYLLAGAMGFELETFQPVHQITETIVTNQTAWAAFIILVANITFYHRNRANEIQEETLELQKKKWNYEKTKIMAEHYEHEARTSSQQGSHTYREAKDSFSSL